MSKEDKQCDRNLKGIQLEKEGKVDEAIKLYESNVRENFDGNHPYDRLAIIYHKQGMIDDEIRVLNHGIKVFTKLLKTSPRTDVEPKLNKFKLRLEKLIK